MLSSQVVSFLRFTYAGFLRRYSRSISATATSGMVPRFNHHTTKFPSQALLIQQFTSADNMTKSKGRNRPAQAQKKQKLADEAARASQAAPQPNEPMGQVVAPEVSRPPRPTRRTHLSPTAHFLSLLQLRRRVQLPPPSHEPATLKSRVCPSAPSKRRTTPATSSTTLMHIRASLSHLKTHLILHPKLAKHHFFRPTRTSRRFLHPPAS